MAEDTIVGGRAAGVNNSLVLQDSNGRALRITATTSGLSIDGYNLNLDDGIGVTLGTDDDAIMVLRASALNAATTLSGVLIGTPVTAATPANSVMLSNVTADGDIAMFTVNAAGADSVEMLRLDASAGLVVINEASADVDTRVETNGNSNALVIDGGTDSAAIGSAVVSGAALSISNAVSRALVTSVGNQIHMPATALTDSGATGTIAVLASVDLNAVTIIATNTITYTDATTLKVDAPVASTGATFTRKYSIWAADQIRTDTNLQILNTATFASTQPVGAAVFQSSGATAPVGAITTGGAIYTDGTTMKKIIAAGTASDIQT